VALVSLRLLQTVAVLLLALRFYQWLGIEPALALLGLMGLSWSMTHGHAAGPLAVESYTALLVALVTCIALCRRATLFLGGVALLAAAEGGLAALLPPVLCLGWMGARGAAFPGRVAWPGAFAIACLTLATAVGLTSLVATAGDLAAQAGAQLRDNLGQVAVWVRVGMALGLLPVLALPLARRTSMSMIVLMCLFVSSWIFFCLSAVPLTETHHLLVPETLVLLPSALLVVQDAQRSTRLEGTPA
jgi:hypothetical protein